MPDSSYPEAAEPLREARDEDLRRLGWVGDGSTVVPMTCPMLHLYFGYGTVLILEYIHTLYTILYYTISRYFTYSTSLLFQTNISTC